MRTLSDEDIMEVLNHQPGSGIPGRYHPPHMYQTPHDAWDTWENEQYENKWPDTVNAWARISAYVHRRLKLNERRKTDPSYCNKSVRNYAKVLNSYTRPSSSYAAHWYEGDLL